MYYSTILCYWSFRATFTICNTDNTGMMSDEELSKKLRKEVDLTPSGIRSCLGLNNSIYKPSAAYGHFGRVPDEEVVGSFSWEKTDLVNKIS